MTWQYTYLWWTGSVTTPDRRGLGSPEPPIGEDALARLNDLGADGWELVDVTAAPLTTGWVLPRGSTGGVGYTTAVHYLALLRRPITGA